MGNQNLNTELNPAGNEITITVGTDTPQLFKSKKAVRAFLVSLVKNEIISQESAQEAHQIVHNAKNLPDIGPDDVEYANISITVIAFGGGFGFSSFFQQEEANDEPMETPQLKMCPRCGEHAAIVDTTGPGGTSKQLYSKQLAYEWLQIAEAKKWVTAEQVTNLKEQIKKSKLQ